MPLPVVRRATGLLFCLLLGGCCLNVEGRLVWALECNKAFLLTLDADHAAASRAGPGGFQPPANLHAELSDAGLGVAAAHRVSCDFEAGQWQLHQAGLQYPEGFRLDERGFSSVGPLGSVVGHYRIDLDFDGVAESSYEVRSSSDFLAFLDMDEDGIEDPFEPQIVLSLSDGMAPVLLLLAPLGGDDLAARMVANRSFRTMLELLPGPIQNPQQPGHYSVVGHFQSVDPDTGGANDGSGVPPFMLSVSVDLDIGVEVMKDGFEALTP